jgi:hypothetical protein
MGWLEDAWKWVRSNWRLVVVTILVILVLGAILQNKNGWNLPWMMIGGFSFGFIILLCPK